ncbi:MAG TPA: serine/threonine-protein kinase [Polyangia bacterium]|nr:serine/threonine-protein kinase [Polyangia bacterium]
MCPVTTSDKEPSLDGSLARGTAVDRFIVLGLVGRGAMGEVYAAHDPELDRKIAIKLLRSRGGEDTADEARARLIREAQAIAKVSHPNVVVVYDVGTFDGRVFIAMEFISGHTLGYWLQCQPRTVAEILEVFTGAGRGLAAAHEKELVHRDFKPENVMVGADGQARVMDFGLVRLAIDREKSEIEKRLPPGLPSRLELNIDPLATFIIQGPVEPSAGGVSDSLALNLTKAGTVMGTPAYMSPEQFRGGATDARTDQFSFCVALYEALYGERPFTGGNTLELTANVLTGQVKAEPNGSRVPRRIRTALLRGMSTEPAARFSSMGALLGELRSEAALAGMRRFAEGAAEKLNGTWEAPEADRPVESETKAEIRRAFLATGKSYAATAFEAMSRILDRFVRRWSEIYVEACEATHLRGEQSTEVLDLRMAALAEALRDLRALCRQLRHTTPDTIENAVNAAHALGTLERCSDINLLRAIVRPPDDPVTRATVDELRGRLSEVRALARVGRVLDGIKMVAPLEADARRIGYAPLTAEVLFLSGFMRVDVSDFEAGTRTLEDAVWAAELCRHDEIAAQSAVGLIFSTGYGLSRFGIAEIWSRHAETVLARMGGHELIRGWLFNNRGAMRAAQGRLRDAVDDQHRAIEAKERALGTDDPDVGISLVNAAIYLDELGETVRAASYLERAVGIMQETLGRDHPKVAIPLANHAELLNRLGRFDEALEPARHALAVLERETDAESVYVAYPLAALGSSYVGLGQFREALPVLERAVHIREAREVNAARIGEVHFTLGRALWGSGEDRTRGLAMVERARSEFRASPPTPATQRELADIELWLASHSDPSAPARAVAAPAPMP